jgi:serine/threonine-protein kinase
MLVGEPPFTGATPRIVMARQVNDPVPPLRARRPDVSPALEAVVEKALAKPAADRYRTTTAFAEALERAAAGRTAGGFISALLGKLRA